MLEERGTNRNPELERKTSILLPITKIVSGGQTGVDRAALDFALKMGVSCGGWCPKGRGAEDGPIGDRYPLIETPSSSYPQRTEWNVRDSDGTLILSYGAPTGGTNLTVGIASRLGKPTFVQDLMSESLDIDGFRAWVETHHIRVLNIAGPRESHAPGKIHGLALTTLHAVLVK